MHPPPFDPSHTLADWPDCFIEARCSQCGRVTIGPLRNLGPPSALIMAVVGRLSCARCRVLAAPVYLCASYHRRRHGGPPADWALELVQRPVSIGDPSTD